MTLQDAILRTRACSRVAGRNTFLNGFNDGGTHFVVEDNVGLLISRRVLAEVFGNFLNHLNGGLDEVNGIKLKGLPSQLEGLDSVYSLLEQLGHLHKAGDDLKRFWINDEDCVACGRAVLSELDEELLKPLLTSLLEREGLKFG